MIVNTPWTRFDVPSFANTARLPPTPYPEMNALINGVVTTSHVGRLLGGSACHNGMIWNRHTKASIILLCCLFVGVCLIISLCCVVLCCVCFCSFLCSCVVVL